MAERSTLHEGLIVASHGRHCMVESPDGERRICHPRGKKSQAVVGDRVLWQAPPPGQGSEGTIEKVQERRNQKRSDRTLRPGLGALAPLSPHGRGPLL